ncbi:MAG: nitrilase family protein [Saprospiraceae bacterium]|nr:nitrilase family protein [Candidatus Vicinibacter affinis]
MHHSLHFYCTIPVVWENPQKAIKELEILLLEELREETDLIIFCEMFTTGFSMNTTGMGEPMDGPCIKWMKKLAASRKCAVCGSLIIFENHQYFNRFVFVHPDGKIDHYDKAHLFNLANEGEYYTAGKSRTLIDYRSWKIMPFICYDLRFPVWLRNTEEADLMIFVAQFPESRRLAFTSLLPARAIENVCFVAGVNALGRDGNDMIYSGDSNVWDYEGHRLGHDTYNKPGIWTFTLSRKTTCL